MSEEDVRQIAEQYLDRVSPSGNTEVKASCPFHTSDNPGGSVTFYMSTETGLWFCHSCNEKGNLSQFLRKMGVGPATIKQQFGEVVSGLASAEKRKPRLSQTRPKVTPTEEPLPESLLGIFDQCPTDLLDEGFTEETLRHFDVGFDDTHMRITFPIRDMMGNLVGIAGRTVVDHPRRYKIYDVEYKEWGLPIRPAIGDILWNVHNVYPEVYFGQDIPVVALEGYKAAMWVHQAGITNVTALMGSYLKPLQQWTLEHLGGVVYIMLDNDDAGRAGAHQVGAALSKSLKVRMMTFRSSAKQPSDLDPREVIEAFENAEDYYLWAIKQKDS